MSFTPRFAGAALVAALIAGIFGCAGAGSSRGSWENRSSDINRDSTHLDQFSYGADDTGQHGSVNRKGFSPAAPAGDTQMDRARDMTLLAQANAQPKPPAGGTGGGSANPNIQQLAENQDDRYLVKEAMMTVEAKDVALAADTALADMQSFGGYVISSEESLTPDRMPLATMTLRVPSSQFEPMLRSLAALGTVLTRKVSSQDVTEEYVDTESALRSKKIVEERVRTYLTNSKSLEETRRLENELDGIQAQIEQLEGRIRFLSTRSSYSTINLTIQTAAAAVKPPTPVESYSTHSEFNQAMSEQVAWFRMQWSSAIYVGLWIAFRLPYFLFWGFLLWTITRFLKWRLPSIKAAMTRPVM